MKGLDRACRRCHPQNASARKAVPHPDGRDSQLHKPQQKVGLSAQLYHFLHNLSETARGEDSVVLAVSIPKSETVEMTEEDQERLQPLQAYA